MKILIVEDEPVSRTLLTGILGDYGKCNTAKNGKAALKEFTRALKKKSPYDLVCLDILMPKLDGHEVLQGLKKVQREEGLKEVNFSKVIMITALSDKDSMVGSFVRGCEGYIIKPVTAGKIKKELKALELI